MVIPLYNKNHGIVYIPEVVTVEAGESCHIASRTYSDFMKGILLFNNRCHEDSCLFHSGKNKYSFRFGVFFGSVFVFDLSSCFLHR